jgi:CheY-like chemotaxis protein
VLVSVSDTGHGMSREVQEKIFDPFFTTKEIGKGTGLGLATAYGIVKQHAGHIRVHSEPDHGTIFKVYLPATDNMETKSVAQRSTVLRAGTETILVVDDEASIRQLVKDILQPLGYRLLEASNGDEALKHCSNASEAIDILLTDVIMPGMNGLELSKTIKARRPEIKTIFMSGYTQNVIVNGGVLKPDLIFIHKPLTSGKLAVALWNALDTGSVSNGVTD